MKEKQSMGGKARAKKLSSQERSIIATKAANDRWNGDLPTASHEGELRIGDKVISCVVLPSGLRIISQSTFSQAVGRARTVRAGTGLHSDVKLPSFLRADFLQPYITDELTIASTPVAYRTKIGGKGIGYDARLLPKVAETYLKYRDDTIALKGAVLPRYQKMISAADMLLRGLADVGIVALIDEATGFQADRAKDALTKILEKFIAKELRPWVHTFPNEFYDNLFRLKGLSFPGDTFKKPQYFGHITNNIIYARLAPGILEELKKETPRDSKGRLKHHMHRRLTSNVGHPRLKEHLASVITLMKVSASYEEFLYFLDKAHPKYGSQLPLGISDDIPENL